jgi:hypothetical protein
MFTTNTKFWYLWYEVFTKNLHSIQMNFQSYIYLFFRNIFATIVTFICLLCPNIIVLFFWFYYSYLKLFWEVYYLDFISTLFKNFKWYKCLPTINFFKWTIFRFIFIKIIFHIIIRRWHMILSIILIDINIIIIIAIHLNKQIKMLVFIK